MWFILENVPCVLHKVYSSSFGWNVLKISMRGISSNVSFKTCISSLTFCFDDLYIDVSGMLKCLTITMFLKISPFISVSICFLYLGAPSLGAYIFMSVKSFSCVDPFNHYLMSFFTFLYGLCFKIFFVQYESYNPHCATLICM